MILTINGVLEKHGLHFSDLSTSNQDKLAGDLLSDIIGDTWIDMHTMAPDEQWTEIAKSLRVHGFQISFKDV